MPLLSYVYHALCSLRTGFSRRSTWVTFSLVLLALIASPQVIGITSLCAFLRLNEAGYYRLLHLFRSSAWRMAALVDAWVAFVLAEDVLVRVEGRAVMPGDHSLAVKEGTRMPGVVTLYQHSETQTKPSFFRGHCWGVIGLLVGRGAQVLFCLPLVATIQQGFAHLRQDAPTAGDQETLATRLVTLALTLAIRHHLPSFLVLDAFFATAPVLTLTQTVWSIARRQPLVEVLTRAKKSYVAYEQAEQPAVRKRGRPRKYGRKLKLYKVFDTHREHFALVSCEVYGKLEDVRILALDLLWKSTRGLVRFVFAVTSRGPIVLMSSDLTLDPVVALRLYCLRVRIETMFTTLKEVLSAFACRLWSKHLPRHSRRPKRNQALLQPEASHLPAVAATWEAYERYAFIHCVAVGLLQLLALRHQSLVWARFGGFLRTRARALPSERTVKQVLAREVQEIVAGVAPGAILEEIQRRLPPPGDSPADQPEAAAA